MSVKQKVLSKSKQFFDFGNWVDQIEKDDKGQLVWKQDGKATIDLAKLIKTRMLIAASSGGGKSWLMRKLMEEFFGYIPQIVIDPEGEFASLKDKFPFLLVTADRDSEGKLLGDIEADPTSADVLALTCLRTHASVIIDISELSIPDRQRFVKNFVEALVNAPREMRWPFIVWIDEAHDYAGEAGKTRKSERENDSLDSVRDLASKGRKRGLALILATQRLAKLDKNVAAELKNYMIGNTNLDNDRERAANILGFTGKEGAVKEQELRIIDPGIFYASGPIFSSGLRTVKVGQVVTHHPEAEEAGTLYTPPPTPESVKPQLEEFKQIPEVKRRKLDEVRELKVRDREQTTTIQSLRMKLQHAENALAKEQVDAPLNPEKIKAVQDEYFARGQKEIIARFNDQFKASVSFFVKTKTLLEQMKGVVVAIESQTGAFKDKLDQVLSMEVPKLPETIPMPEIKPAASIYFKRTPSPVTRPPMISNPVRVQPTLDQNPLDGDPSSLGKAERAILKFLAMRPGKSFSREQIGAITNYAPKGGSFNTHLSKLNTRGLIRRQGDGISINPDAVDQAIAILGDEYSTPEQGSLETWLEKLPSAPKKIYQVLLNNPDTAYTREELGEAVGYVGTGGSFNTYISQLVTLGLAQRVGGKIQFNQELLGI